MRWSSFGDSSSTCCQVVFRRCGTTGSWVHMPRSRSKRSAGSSRSRTANSSGCWSRPRPTRPSFRHDAAASAADSSESSRSSRDDPQPSTTRADRMPCLHHTRIPTLNSHRAGRDSDAVRARLGFWRCRCATALGQSPSAVLFPCNGTSVLQTITTVPRLSRSP